MTGFEAADNAQPDFTASRYTGDAVAGKAAVPLEVADRFWRALGHPDAADDDELFTDDDIRALSLVTDGWATVDPDNRQAALDLVLQSVRSLSALLMSVAEAQVALTAGLEQAGLGRRLLDGGTQHWHDGSDLSWLLGYVLRSRQTIDDYRRASDGTEQLAIGFTDLVGYTRLSSDVADDVLADTIAQFQSVAFDAIAESGSRAVKLIGDAVMYVAPTPEGVLEAARTIHADKTRLTLPARTGLAFGRVFKLAGDFYGPAVNLASRLAGVGKPNQILANESLVDHIETANEFVFGITDLKGLGPTPTFVVAAQHLCKPERHQPPPSRASEKTENL